MRGRSIENAVRGRSPSLRGSPGKVPPRRLCKDLKEIRGKMPKENHTAGGGGGCRRAQQVQRLEVGRSLEFVSQREEAEGLDRDLGEARR